MNVTTVIPVFSQAELDAFVQLYTLGDLQYQQYFPEDYTPFMTYNALKAKFSGIVAADIVAFDSRAPRKGRQAPGKVTSDIPKVEIAMYKNETDINTFRILQATINGSTPAAAKAAKNAIFDWMYGDAAKCQQGVDAKLEWMAKQALSSGEYSLTQTNNPAGTKTNTSIKFGIPSGNIANAPTDWYSATPSVPKPITEIKALVVSARAAGYNLKYMWMEQATFDKIVLCDEMTKFTATYITVLTSLQQTPNLQDVNRALANANLPTIIIWESYFQIESKAGVLTTDSGWVAGNVTFTQDRTPGVLAWTTSADAFIGAESTATKSINGKQVIKVWADEDPIAVTTKATAYATPVLQGVDGIYIRKTKLS